MGVQDSKLLHRALLQPGGQPLALASIQGIEQDHRQGKVIDKVAMLADLARQAIVFMDFR